jgi:pilus assembly protein Flp/PilA
MLWLKVRNWLRREEGQDLAEYALLIGLIAIAVVAAVTLLGEQISTVLSAIGAEMLTWPIP